MAAILKKKVLMQVRDKKTLSIDTIFPIFLIIAGLALSTINFIKDSPPREMSPFVMQENLNVIWNTNSNFITDSTTIQDFMVSDWVGLNSSHISIESSMAITPSNPQNIIEDAI
jgi:hypothetical protein